MSLVSNPSRRHLFALAALALAACTGGGPTDSGDTNDTGDTGDTGPSYAQPWWFQFGFFFGYEADADAGTDQFITYALDDAGQTVIQDPTAILVLFEDSAGSLGDDICLIIVEQTGPITPTALNDGAVKKGFVFDWDEATITHDCDGLLDPDVWGADFPERLKTVNWGVGLTGTVDATTRTSWLGLVDDDSDWDGHMSGARPYLSSTGTLRGESQEFYFARGIELDTDVTPPAAKFDDTNSNGQWEDGESGVFLDGADVAAGPVTGAYLVTSPYVLQLGETLDQFFIAP